MIDENALVIYKGKPALVKEKIDGKFSISLADGALVKVRDKDIDLIHPGPCKSFSEINNVDFSSNAIYSDSGVCEAWELLLSEEESVPLTIKNLASFIYNEYTPSCAYAVFCLINDGLYFSGEISAITLRSREDVTAEQNKRAALQRETGEREQFLNNLKECLKNPALQATQFPAHYIQDVEALAYGKTTKSRTMRDIGLSETPEDAHSVLLKTGFWTYKINPHPLRFGLSLSAAAVKPSSVLDEERRDLCRLRAFAIDSPWSGDPDDAVSIEQTDDGSTFLYVHIADPSSCIAFDSPAEKEARGRGATLYLPEITVRMLAEDYIPMFALGLSEKSLALTFKMLINNKGEVAETEIFPSVVSVRRISYEDADKEIEKDSQDAQALRSLFSLSQIIFSRRSAHGAVNIDLHDVHITAEDGVVNIDPIPEYRSSLMVRECMLAAGEGTGTWAASRGLAFPYISQEVELQSDYSKISRLGGFASSIQLRRCMRPRILSVKPGRHQGMGLDIYTQVTSPLRRYTDLLAHIQIRSFLRGGKPLSADDISSRIGYCEAAVSAVNHAERASNNHWIMVFLSDKKDSVWDAVAVENKGNRWVVLITSLSLETQIPLQKNVSPNDEVKLILKSVNIAKGEAVFIQSI